MILCTKATNIKFDIVAKCFAGCALDFIFVLKFLSRGSASRRSTKSVNLERSSTCAPSNRLSVIRAEGVDQIFLLVFVGEGLMFVLTDKRKEARQIGCGEKFVFLVLACLL